MRHKHIYIIAAVLPLLMGVIIFLGTFSKPNTPPPIMMEDGSDITGLSKLVTVNDYIYVTSLKEGEIIQSPLTVKGFARGTWYFEASFPVKIVDSKGNVLGQSPAQAESDWMTEQMVPFSGKIEFTAKEGEKGEVIFEKDNPSGLPENAGELRIPIIFGK